MSKFKELLEVNRKDDLPAPPGTSPIRSGYVRLYHQTGLRNVESIRQHGIKLDKAKGYEGPAAVYAAETPFYGAVDDFQGATVEFAIPRERWDKPFVRGETDADGISAPSGDVEPRDIIAIHEPWHSHARYIEKNSKLKQEVLKGEQDGLLDDPEYGPAVRYIKHKYGR